MKRKMITAAILLFSLLSMYYAYNLSNGYYSKSFYNVEITADTSEITLEKTGGDALINVSLANNSRKFISSGDNVFIGYHIIDLSGNVVLFDSARFPFPDIMPFNKQEMIPVTIENIRRAGEYTVQIDMVEENVAWFSGRGNQMYEIKLTIKD